MGSTSFTIDRYDRSPLEFEGVLMVESDGLDLSVAKAVATKSDGSESPQPRYRIRVYKESQRDFVLELAILAGDSVLFQTADIAESVCVIEELLCLLHQDAMDGLLDTVPVQATEKGLLNHRLEANLDRQTVLVLQQLNDKVAT